MTDTQQQDVPHGFTQITEGRIRTTDIVAATGELSVIYAAQGVAVSTDGKQIMVQPVSDIHAEPGSDASTAAPPCPSVPIDDQGTRCQFGDH